MSIFENGADQLEVMVTVGQKQEETSLNYVLVVISYFGFCRPCSAFECGVLVKKEWLLVFSYTIFNRFWTVPFGALVLFLAGGDHFRIV